MEMVRMYQVSKEGNSFNYVTDSQNHVLVRPFGDIVTQGHLFLGKLTPTKGGVPEFEYEHAKDIFQPGDEIDLRVETSPGIGRTMNWNPKPGDGAIVESVTQMSREKYETEILNPYLEQSQSYRDQVDAIQSEAAKKKADLGEKPESLDARLQRLANQ